ncbi:MAG: hypothetical protein R2710_19005 [Acidimicrobiales bacterium]
MSSAAALLGTVTRQIAGGGELRPGQVTMAEEVTKTLTGPDTLLIEAGTGTGKSVAYLTPVLDAQKRAVVATATIALQSQLVEKDVPMVAAALGREVSVSVLKGRWQLSVPPAWPNSDRASHTGSSSSWAADRSRRHSAICSTGRTTPRPATAKSSRPSRRSTCGGR